MNSWGWEALPKVGPHRRPWGSRDMLLFCTEGLTGGLNSPGRELIVTHLAPVLIFSPTLNCLFQVLPPVTNLPVYRRKMQFKNP